MSYSLGDLILELRLDPTAFYGQLEQARLASARTGLEIEKNLQIGVKPNSQAGLQRELEVTGNKYAQVGDRLRKPLTPTVDDRALTDLNKHLDKKEAHWNSVVGIFGRKPIRPSFDGSGFAEAEAETDKAIDRQKRAQEEINGAEIRPVIAPLHGEKLQQDLQFQRQELDKSIEYFNQNPIVLRVDTSELDAAADRLQQFQLAIKDASPAQAAKKATAGSDRAKQPENATQPKAPSVKQNINVTVEQPKESIASKAADVAVGRVLERTITPVVDLALEEGFTQVLGLTSKILKEQFGGIQFLGIGKVLAKDIDQFRNKLQKEHAPEKGVTGRVQKATKEVESKVGKVVSAPAKIISAPITGVLKGFYEGIGNVYGGRFGKGSADRLEKGMGRSIEDLGSTSGKFANKITGLDAINALVDKIGKLGRVEAAASPVLKKYGIDLDAESMQDKLEGAVVDYAERLGQILDKSLDEGTIKADIDSVKDALLGLGKAIAVTNDSAAKAQALEDLSGGLKKVAAYPRQAVIGRYKAGAKESAKDLEARMESTPTPAEELDKRIRKVAFVSAGFSATEGKQSHNMAAEIAKHGGDHVKVVPFENREFDVTKDASKDGIPAWAANVLEKVSGTIDKGYNPAAVRMAAEAYQYKQKNPEIDIDLIGHSAGGLIAKEAQAILKELGVEARVLAMGTPNLGAFKGNKPSGEIVMGGGDVMRMISDNALSKAPDVAGHELPHYLGDPETQKKLRAFLNPGVEAEPDRKTAPPPKPVAKKAEEPKAAPSPTAPTPAREPFRTRLYRSPESRKKVLEEKQLELIPEPHPLVKQRDAIKTVLEGAIDPRKVEVDVESLKTSFKGLAAAIATLDKAAQAEALGGLRNAVGARRKPVSKPESFGANDSGQLELFAPKRQYGDTQLELLDKSMRPIRQFQAPKKPSADQFHQLELFTGGGTALEPKKYKEGIAAASQIAIASNQQFAEIGANLQVGLGKAKQVFAKKTKPVKVPPEMGEKVDALKESIASVQEEATHQMELLGKDLESAHAATGKAAESLHGSHQPIQVPESLKKSLDESSKADLLKMAKSLGLKGFSKDNKAKLTEKIMAADPQKASQLVGDRDAVAELLKLEKTITAKVAEAQKIKDDGKVEKLEELRKEAIAIIAQLNQGQPNIKSGVYRSEYGGIKGRLEQKLKTNLAITPDMVDRHQSKLEAGNPKAPESKVPVGASVDDIEGLARVGRSGRQPGFIGKIKASLDNLLKSVGDKAQEIALDKINDVNADVADAGRAVVAAAKNGDLKPELINQGRKVGSNAIGKGREFVDRNFQAVAGPATSGEGRFGFTPNEDVSQKIEQGKKKAQLAAQGFGIWKRTFGKNLDKNYSEFARQVAKASNVEMKPGDMPKLEVDDRRLKKMGVQAFYDIKANRVIVSKEIAKALDRDSGQLKNYEEELKVVAHELRHAAQFNFGRKKISDISAGRTGFAVKIKPENQATGEAVRKAEESVSAVEKNALKKNKYKLSASDRATLKAAEVDAYSFEGKTGDLIKNVTGNLKGQSKKDFDVIAGYANKAASMMVSHFAQKFPALSGIINGMVSKFKMIPMQLLQGFAAIKVFELLAQKIPAIAGASVEAAQRFERLGLKMNFAAGSAIAAQRNFAMVRAEALRLGTDLEASAAGFVGITTAAKGGSLEGVGAESIFKSLNQASSVYQLDGETQGRAYNAVQQMISKGASISSEELKQQLGEALPGTIQIAARAAGKSTGEFTKMLESGQVLVDDFLPKFANQLAAETSTGVAGAADTAQASLNRLNATMTDLKVRLGTPLLEVQKQGFKAFNAVLLTLMPVLPALTVGIGAGLAKAAFTGAAAVFQFATGMSLAGVLGKVFATFLTMLPKLFMTLGGAIMRALPMLIAFQAAMDSIGVVGKIFKNAGQEAKDASDQIGEFNRKYNEMKGITAESGNPVSNIFDNIKAGKGLTGNINSKQDSAMGDTIVGKTLDFVFGKGATTTVEQTIQKSIASSNEGKGLQFIADKIFGKDSIKIGSTYADKKHNDLMAENREFEFAAGGTRSKAYSMFNAVTKKPQGSLGDTVKIDQQLQELNAKRRMVQPGDAEGRRSLDKQIADLRTQRESVAKEASAIQGQLAAQVQARSNLIKGLKEYRDSGQVTGAELTEVNEQIAAMEGGLEADQKALEKFNKVLGHSADEARRLKESIENIDFDSQAQQRSLNAKLTTQKTDLSNKLVGKGSGSRDESFAKLELQQLDERTRLNKQLIDRYRDMLSSAESQRSLSIAGIDGNDPNLQGAQLRKITARMTDGQEKVNLDLLADAIDKMRDLETDTASMGQQIADVRHQSAERLRESTKQVQEFYRGIERQAKESALDFKKAAIEIKTSNAQNRLSGAIKGMQDNYISQYVDGLVDLVGQMQEAVKMGIDQQKEEMGKINNLQDQIRNAQELSKTLPSGNEGMGVGGAGESSAEAISVGPTGKGVDTSKMNLWSTGGGSELINSSSQLRPHHNMNGAYNVKPDATYNSLGQVVLDLTFEDKATKNVNVPIPAPVSGTVVSAGIKGGYGNAVLIKEAKTGEEVLLGHLKSISVKAGQQLTEGMEVGIQGGTGRGGVKRFPEHLHLEASKSIAKRYADNVIQGKYKGIVGKSEEHFEGDGHDHGGAKRSIKQQAVDFGKVTLQRTGQMDEAGLEKLLLKVVDRAGNVKLQNYVNSGDPTKQNKFTGSGRSTAEVREPLEYGKYNIGQTVASGIKGVGDYFTPIEPQFNTSRSALGIHYDQDRLTRAGSAGCVVFKTEAEFMEFQKALKAAGVSELVFKDGKAATPQTNGKPQYQSGAPKVGATPRTAIAKMTLPEGLTSEGREMATYLQNPNVKALLDAVARSEGLEGKAGGGYDLGYGYRKIQSLKAHPYNGRELTPGGESSASGRYQFMGHTWKEMSGQLGLKDFSPMSQDIAAVKLLKRRGTLQSIAAGRVDESVLNKLAPEWASIEHGAGSGAGYYPGQLTNEGRQSNLISYFQKKAKVYKQGGSTPALGVMMPTTGMSNAQIEKYQIDASAYADLQKQIQSGVGLSSSTTEQSIALSRQLSQSQQVKAKITADRQSRKLIQGLKEGGRGAQDETEANTRQIEDLASSLGPDTPYKTFRKQVIDLKRNHADMNKALTRKEEKDNDALADLKSSLPEVEALVAQGMLPDKMLSALKAQIPVMEGVVGQNAANRKKLNELTGKTLKDIDEKYKYQQNTARLQLENELNAADIAKSQARAEKLKSEAEKAFASPDDRKKMLIEAATLDRNAKVSQLNQSQKTELKQLADNVRNDPQTYTPEKVALKKKLLAEATADQIKQAEIAMQNTIDTLNQGGIERQLEVTRDATAAKIKELQGKIEAIDLAAKDETLLRTDPRKANELQQQSVGLKNQAEGLQKQLDLTEALRQQDELVRSGRRTKEEAENAKKELISMSQVDMSNLQTNLQQNTEELKRQNQEIEYQSKARVFDIEQQYGAEKVRNLREVQGNGLGALDLQKTIDLGKLEFDLEAKLRDIDLDKTITPEAKKQISDRLREIAKMQANDLTVKATLAREDLDFQGKTLQFQSAMSLNSARGNTARAYGFEWQGQQADKQGAIAQEQYNLADGLRKIDDQARQLGLAPEVVEQLKNNLQSLNAINLQNINAQFNPLVEGLKGIKTAFQGFLGDVISGNSSIGDAFNKMVDNVLNSLSNLAAQLITEQLFGSLFGLGKGAGGGGNGGKSAGGGLGGIIGSIFGLKDGGEVPNVDHRAMRDRPDAIGFALRKEGPNAVLAALTPGEEVLNPKESKRFRAMGLNNLLRGPRSQFNPAIALRQAAASERGRKVYNFAMGGVVPGGPPVQSNPAAAGGQTNVNVPITINGGGDASINIPRMKNAIEVAVQQELNKRQRPRNS